MLTASHASSTSMASSTTVASSTSAASSTGSSSGCPAGDFQCDSGIPGNFVCDGIPDCADGSDEAPINPNCP